MKKIHLLLSYSLLLGLSGCEPKFNFEGIDLEPQIVVEGWIETGEAANVCLSQSITLNEDSPYIPLSDIPLRWAKVSVSDGTQEEILTGRMDANYTPPFVYRGNRIRGEAGKTYRLKVEYSGLTVTAETTIPPVTPIERLEVSPCEDSDTLYQIRIRFRDNPEEKNYYKIFTLVRPDETRYYPAFMGTVSDETLHDHLAEMNVSRGMRYTETGKYTPYFKESDSVLVKLTQIGEKEFGFWSGYENEIVNGKNPFFPSSNSLSSNIRGGKGIWCGYGKDIRLVTIKDSIK